MNQRIRLCNSLIAIVVCLAGAPSGLYAGQGSASSLSLSMQDPKEWTFEGGAWRVDADGTMRPPEAYQEFYAAFYQPRSYGDLETNFEFRIEQIFCDAGLILHAQDAGNYYLVHFPTGGQQWRAKHFWLSVSRTDAGGYKHMLKLAMVPQVNANVYVWHRARVVLKGAELQVWVDGHQAATVNDRGLLNPGRVGVAGFGMFPRADKFQIRNLRIEGISSDPKPWPPDIHPVKNWFYPCPDATYGKWQHLPSLVRTPQGDLLMAFAGTQDALMEAKNTVTWESSRSTDGGRHWSKPEPLKVAWPWESGAEPSRKNAQGQPWNPAGDPWGSGPFLFVTTDKRLMFQYEKNDQIYMAESYDDGHTWKVARRAKVNGEWPKDPNNLSAYGPLLSLKDGTLLRTLQGTPILAAMEVYEFDWGAWRCKAFTSRSTDRGKSWSVPTDMDGSPAIPEVEKPRSTTLDLTEASCVQVQDGTVKCYIRPHNSPFMWVTESRDSGQSWSPTSFGAFPGYAANAFYTSGRAILVAHRMPHLAINTSYDDGLNWDQGTIIGTDGMWAMGDMVEVAPNVVLFVYMSTQQGFLHAQFIRVTPEGLQPALEMLPKQ